MGNSFMKNVSYDVAKIQVKTDKYNNDQKPFFAILRDQDV